MRIIFISLMAALLSACAIGVVVPESSYPSVYHPDKTHRTKEDVANQWRSEEVEPDVSHALGREIWTYRYSNEWCGALLILPLMLPACSHADIYHFEGEKLVEHELKLTSFYGGVCSIFPACDTSGCSLCFIEKH